MNIICSIIINIFSKIKYGFTNSKRVQFCQVILVGAWTNSCWWWCGGSDDCYLLIQNCQAWMSYTTTSQKLPLQVYSSDGVLLGQFGQKHRIYVDLIILQNFWLMQSYRQKMSVFMSTVELIFWESSVRRLCFYYYWAFAIRCQLLLQCKLRNFFLTTQKHLLVNLMKFYFLTRLSIHSVRSNTFTLYQSNLFGSACFMVLLKLHKLILADL